MRNAGEPSPPLGPLSVEQAVVIGVLLLDRWLTAIAENFPGFEPIAGLWGFVGRDAPTEMARPYLRHKVPVDLQRARGAANPIRLRNDYRRVASTPK